MTEDEEKILNVLQGKIYRWRPCNTYLIERWTEWVDMREIETQFSVRGPLEIQVWRNGSWNPKNGLMVWDKDIYMYD